MVHKGGAVFVDRLGGPGEKGVMTSSRTLLVGAIVAAGALLGVACGDDMGTSGLSVGSVSVGQSSGSSGSGGSGDTTGPTTTNSSNSEGSSTGLPDTSSTGLPDTTTTGPSTTTTTDPTNGTTTTDPTNGAMCGNGAIDGNEQCDGANLNGFTCEALGNAGGTLQCDAVTCTFDTQLCEGGGGTSG
jgi:hypothetical protein